MSRLFEPLHIGNLELENRIVVAPMCQYSAVGGNAQDWHLIHLGHLALSGSGMLIIEATAVSPEGRITPGDLGLYSDENEAALARVIRAVAEHTHVPLTIQLAHAGRKASSRKPWEGGAQILPGESLGWRAVAPSAIPHAENEDLPIALNVDGLTKILEDFASASRRSVALGFRGIELHMAHGYLLHQFLSPLSNKRTDEYGGRLENRMRFPLEVFDAIRSAISNEIPVWVRVSATDWVPGGWDVDDTIALGRALKGRGCAAIHVSSGGVSTKQEIPLSPGYQVPLAARLKAEVGLPTIAVGLITEPEHAEAIIRNGEADAIALARGMLYNPRWPWHAAAALGAEIYAPCQYWRSQPRAFKSLFKDAKIGQR